MRPQSFALPLLLLTVLAMPATAQERRRSRIEQAPRVYAGANFLVAQPTGEFSDHIDQAFGGWAKADKAHFADGGSFDQIYSKSK